MQAPAMTQRSREKMFRGRYFTSMTYRLRDFTSMNTLICRISNNVEDPQEFVDEVHKIFVAMGSIDTEKEELTSYELKDVAQTWCKIWQDSRAIGELRITW